MRKRLANGFAKKNIRESDREALRRLSVLTKLIYLSTSRRVSDEEMGGRRDQRDCRGQRAPAVEAQECSQEQNEASNWNSDPTPGSGPSQVRL